MDKKSKEYNLVLYNDPMQSFEHVVNSLQSCLNMTIESASKHAMMIHTKSRSVIFSGLLEHVEVFHEAMESYENEVRDEVILPPLKTKIVKNKNFKK